MARLMFVTYVVAFGADQCDQVLSYQRQKCRKWTVVSERKIIRLARIFAEVYCRWADEP